jgi:hypothetical protein
VKIDNGIVFIEGTFTDSIETKEKAGSGLTGEIINKSESMKFISITVGAKFTILERIGQAYTETLKSSFCKRIHLQILNHAQLIASVELVQAAFVNWSVVSFFDTVQILYIFFF